MPAFLKNNGKMVSVSKTICNELNGHFVKIGEKLGVQMTNINDNTFINFRGKRQVYSVYLRPTDDQRIIEITACLTIRKSPGYIDFKPNNFNQEN